MTQRFEGAGVVPVTVISAGPCTVTQIKARGSKDGYAAMQVGYDDSAKRTRDPQKGHLKGLSQFRYMREFRGEFEAVRGQVISVSTFQPGDVVSVMGVGKGKGFQGVVKRHKFHGSPKTHGHKDQLRMPGSIGAGGVQHVFKGRRMAGHMGGERVTVKNLLVVDVDAERNLLYVKGAVPGARNALIAVMGDGMLVVGDAKTSVVEAKTTEAPATGEAVSHNEANSVESGQEELTADAPQAAADAAQTGAAEAPQPDVKEKTETPV